MPKYVYILPFFLLFSLQSAAEDVQAYTWENVLTLETVQAIDGGIAKGSREQSNLDLTLLVDTAAADWWGNGNFFIYVLGNYGKAPSDLTGDLQTISNLQAENNLKLYEFWYEHSFYDGAFKTLIGLHDFNSTFYSLTSAGLFANSSFGIGPDVSQVGPSIFPTTSAAVQFTFTHENQYLLLGAYDGIPGDPEHPRGTHVKFKSTDGLFKAIEWGLAQENAFKLAIGAWQHTAEFDNAVSGTTDNSNNGLYVIGEKNLTEHWVVFFQYGHANADKNQLDVYTGAGVTLNNPWVDGDALGLGYANAKNGAPFLENNSDLLASETVWELTYQRPVCKKVNVQSSVYYVEHPSMSPELPAALALGIRLYITL